MSIYRVKTIDDWQAQTGQQWDFETQTAADHHAVAASLIRDDVLYGVARVENDAITETSFAIGGVLFGVEHTNEPGA